MNRARLNDGQSVQSPEEPRAASKTSRDPRPRGRLAARPARSPSDGRCYSRLSPRAAERGPKSRALWTPAYLNRTTTHNTHAHGDRKSQHFRLPPPSPLRPPPGAWHAGSRVPEACGGGVPWSRALPALGACRPRSLAPPKLAHGMNLLAGCGRESLSRLGRQPPAPPARPGTPETNSGSEIGQRTGRQVRSSGPTFRAHAQY